ncbi:MAG: acyl-CoA dehydrogenase family protein [Chloroflexia bacterium]|nr:acyl-CoA dehydrogenase family protein [Chloroflexia bacterium]
MTQPVVSSGVENDAVARLLARAEAVAGQCAELAAETDATPAFPTRAFERIAEADLLAAPVSQDLGGAGLDGSAATRSELLTLLKTVGRGDLSVGRLYEGHVNALQLIQTFGRPEQLAVWAADACARQLLFGVWNTEAGDGVKLFPLEGGRFRLVGAKTFASGAGNVQRPIVTGTLPDGGWQMVVVPADEVNVAIDPSWWRPLGMQASTSYKIDFSGVELGAEYLLGEPGDYFLQPWFFGGAIRFAAVQLGGAEALLNETRRFLQSLDRTGDLYQQARIAEGAIAIESGNLWLRGAAQAVDFGLGRHTRSDIDRMVNYANMTRLAIETICLDVIRLTERAVGARGLLQPLPIERIIRDLTLYLRQPAPDAALASVGRMMLERATPVHEVWRD